MNPKIMCFSGSTKFKDMFFALHKKYTMAGYITLIPAFFAKAGDYVSNEEQTALFDLHLAKLNLCDIVFVINVGGYLGDSTKLEIEYAKTLGKEIWYLEKENTQ